MNMKVLFPILAVYLLLVFLMPCTDMRATETLKQHKHSEEIANKKHYDSSDSLDLCSPFCSCNCCGKISGFVFQWDIIQFRDIKKITFSEQILHYTPQYIPNFFEDIWQPPKILI